MATVESMRALGIDNIRFNTVIKNDNLDQLMPIVHRAEELGCGVNFSTYTDNKNGNREHLLQENPHAEVEAVIAEILSYKKRKRGVVTDFDYYLVQVPWYVRGEMMGTCQ